MMIIKLDGQSIEEQVKDFNSLEISGKIEVIRNEVQINKSRFDKMNVELTGQFKSTSESIGPMYFIVDKQKKRNYRLDIAVGECSSEFIRVYLERPKLRSIYRITNESEKSLYGENGKNGVVTLKTRNLRGINTDKCGFHMLDKNYGDNFTIVNK